MSNTDATSSIQNAEPANPVSTPFQFPIRKADGSQYNSADELHTVLQAENTGHFLLGKYGFWHGGIHITDASAPQCVRDEPLRAIADGVVVAYRINRDHLSSNLLGIEMQYSSSFVLIRHDYHSPANAEKWPDKGKQNSLTFYSLYMHLLPWAQYEESAEAVSNDRIKFEVCDYLARSAIKGESDCVEYGRIPVGSVFEILEESAMAYTKACDKQLINAIYDRRVMRVQSGEYKGQLYYFRHNSLDVQKGVAQRFNSESGRAKERLKNERYY